LLNRRHTLLGALGTGIAATGGTAIAAPDTDALRAVLQQAVGAGGAVAGMVAVAIDADGATSMATYGSSGTDGVALDADAVFPVMSNSKIFTSLLLAEMAGRGEVGFGDPVAKYLPVTPPVTGRAITLLDLASYTSGLPVMPGNINMDAPGDYTEAMLFEFLAGYVPKYAAGTHYLYANLAFGLLGIALARRAGKSYEALLMERICVPLGLSHTRVTLTGEMKQHLVQGHEVSLKPATPWNVPVMPGMASLCSNAADLATFLKACMDPSSLSGPLARLTQTRRPTSLAGTQAGLGWFITIDGGEEIVWKTGLGSGCNTFIGFSPRRRRGAVVLTNFLWLPIDTGTTRIGMKMIKPDFPDLDFRTLYPFG
jgi:D-alanyl-D-alanine-carboxypeptidase/D-alanyl-D-alanine-endopeptidase